MNKLVVFGAIIAALTVTACNRNGPKGPPAKFAVTSGSIVLK